MVKGSKRSPLKTKPLRNPGQSVQNQLNRLFDNEVFPSFFLIAITLTSAFMAWLPIIFSANPVFMAIALTVIFLLVTPFSIRKILRAINQAKNYKLGQDGEKTVAEYLDKIRSENRFVFHDLPGKGFNIDHILISKQGIFAIETKTFSKSTDKNEKIVFNGKTIQIGEYEDHKILKQAEIERSSLKKIIEEATGKTFPIKSIITFPGWFIETTGRDVNRNVFVFYPDYFERFIKQQPEIISETDVKQVVSQLEKYIRNFTE